MNLGIAIYPDQGEINELKSYIKLAHKYGYRKIFSCFLSLNEPQKQVAKYTEIFKFARELNFEILLDVSPAVFQKLNLEYGDLSFFKQLNATAIRLDEPFDAKTESLLTFNEDKIEINLNISNDVSYLDTIIDYQANLNQISGSHNFYPLINSGLSINHFLKTTKRFKKYNLKTGAFINSKVAQIGSGYSKFGACTLEIHRQNDVDVQAKFFKYSQIIDDVYFANMYASETELKQVAEIIFAKTRPITLTIQREDTNTEIENKIIDMLHFYRGDVNQVVIRSTMPRVKYKVKNPVKNVTKKLTRGDIVIINNEIDHYQNELQLVLEDFTVSHSGYNLVAKVNPDELVLIDFIKPWSKFKLKEQYE